MKKRFLTLAMLLTMTFGSVTSVHAAESQKQLTPKQQAVIDSYESVTISNMSELVTHHKAGKATYAAARATSKTYRGSLYRGSALMWSRDNIQWTISGGKVTGSTAWQESGYIFPNIVRTTGIKKHCSTSSSVTYRATKTIGAGIVTPWGDVTVYEQRFADFLKGNKNGTVSTWQ